MSVHSCAYVRVCDIDTRVLAICILQGRLFAKYVAPLFNHVFSQTSFERCSFQGVPSHKHVHVISQLTLALFAASVFSANGLRYFASRFVFPVQMTVFVSFEMLLAKLENCEKNVSIQ